MAIQYKHVIMIGASSGIGAAMADRLIYGGAKVKAVARRKDRLDDFLRRHGEKKGGPSPFDIGNLELTPQFAVDAGRTSPDIDCVFLNAGIQRRYDFSHPEKISLAEFNLETNVNLLSFVALIHAFLPFLMKTKSQTSFIFTGSNLAIVPATTLPAYSASKAGLKVFVLCLRDQLRDSSRKVIEFSPPQVQTELHDVEMGEDAGRKFGMPLDTFTEQAYKGLAAGHDQILIGSIGPEKTFNEIIDK